MRKIKEKLRSKKGETLVEVLMSSLLAGIALLILFSMIQVSYQLMGKGERLTQDVYEKRNQIEKMDMEPIKGKVTIKDQDNMQVEIQLSIYKTEDETLAVYQKSQ